VKLGRRTSAAVVALAGRRIDAEGTDPPRFPLANVPLVRKRLAELLVTENAAAVVCSAACGADLVALEEAERLGLRRRIVLPFRRERFRETSVIDRPGNWGPAFDRLVSAAEAARELVVLAGNDDDDNAAYLVANEAIINEAKQLVYAGASLQRLVAVVVWEGSPSGNSDTTDNFHRLAAARGFEMRTVFTDRRLSSKCDPLRRFPWVAVRLSKGSPI
jgi:hypothetical protein